MLEQLLASIAGPITAVISDFAKRAGIDKDLEARLQAELGAALANQISSSMAQQMQVLLAEINSQSWMARNWRPALMFVFIAIIANNYMLAPLIHGFTGAAVVMPLPSEMWSLMNIAIGGYIGLRGAEKIATTIAKKVSK